MTLGAGSNLGNQSRGAAAAECTRALRIALVWLAAIVVVAGCNLRMDASLYVSNHSGAAWYLAVDSRDSMHFVSKIGDGAEGLALTWESGGDRVVSVLDMSCEVVATFQVQPDGSFFLPAVPGLTATIEARHRIGAGYANGIEATSDCGGMGYA